MAQNSITLKRTLRFGLWFSRGRRNDSGQVNRKCGPDIYELLEFLLYSFFFSSGPLHWQSTGFYRVFTGFFSRDPIKMFPESWQVLPDSSSRGVEQEIKGRRSTGGRGFFVFLEGKRKDPPPKKKQKKKTGRIRRLTRHSWGPPKMMTSSLGCTDFDSASN